MQKYALVTPFAGHYSKIQVHKHATGIQCQHRNKNGCIRSVERLARQRGLGSRGRGEGGIHNDFFRRECAARSWKPLPYFRPRIYDFSIPHFKPDSKCTPYFRPKWQNPYPISDYRCWKMKPFVAAHTYMAYGSNSGSNAGDLNTPRPPGILRAFDPLPCRGGGNLTDRNVSGVGHLTTTLEG